MSDDFFSFDEALDELRLKEEELKRLVSEGEIRAFRKGDTMKLRRSDVESLRVELSGGELVDLGDTTEELIFEDEVVLSDGDAGMATQEIASVETIIDDGIEDVGELELDFDEDDEDEEAAPAIRRSAAAAAGIGLAEEKTEGAGMLAAMLATTAVLILGVPIALSTSSGLISGTAKSIAGLFGFQVD